MNFKYKGVGYSGQSPLSILLPFILIGALLYFFGKPIVTFIQNWLGGLTNVGNTISETIGLSDSAETKKVDEIKIQTAQAGNFWHPDFHKYAPSGSLLLKDAICKEFHKELDSCFSAFSSDYNKCFALFKKYIKTQSQCSWFAEYFYKNTNGRDLYSYLRGINTFTFTNLSDKELKSIHDYISKLPKYKI